MKFTYVIVKIYSTISMWIKRYIIIIIIIIQLFNLAGSKGGKKMSRITNTSWKLSKLYWIPETYQSALSSRPCQWSVRQAQASLHIYRRLRRGFSLSRCYRWQDVSSSPVLEALVASHLSSPARGIHSALCCWWETCITDLSADTDFSIDQWRKSTKNYQINHKILNKKHWETKQLE